MNKIIISIGMLVSALVINASIGDVIGGAIDSSIGAVHDAVHDTTHHVHHDRFMRGPNSAFDQRYKAAEEQIRELQNANVSPDQKKQNVNRIITLSNEMVDSMAPELAAEQVQSLRTYVSNEAKRMKSFQNAHDFNAAADVATGLIEYLSQF